MFIGTTSIFIFCIALFMLDVRAQENERKVKEAQEEKDKEKH